MAVVDRQDERGSTCEVRYEPVQAVKGRVWALAGVRFRIAKHGRAQRSCTRDHLVPLRLPGGGIRANMDGREVALGLFGWKPYIPPNRFKTHVCLIR